MDKQRLQKIFDSFRDALEAEQSREVLEGLKNQLNIVIRRSKQTTPKEREALTEAANLRLTAMEQETQLKKNNASQLIAIETVDVFRDQSNEIELLADEISESYNTLANSGAGRVIVGDLERLHDIFINLADVYRELSIVAESFKLDKWSYFLEQSRNAYFTARIYTTDHLRQNKIDLVLQQIHQQLATFHRDSESRQKKPPSPENKHNLFGTNSLARIFHSAAAASQRSSEAREEKTISIEDLLMDRGNTLLNETTPVSTPTKPRPTLTRTKGTQSTPEFQREKSVSEFQAQLERSSTGSHDHQAKRSESKVKLYRYHSNVQDFTAFIGRKYDEKIFDEVLKSFNYFFNANRFLRTLIYIHQRENKLDYNINPAKMLEFYSAALTKIFDKMPTKHLLQLYRGLCSDDVKNLRLTLIETGNDANFLGFRGDSNAPYLQPYSVDSYHLQSIIEEFIEKLREVIPGRDDITKVLSENEELSGLVKRDRAGQKKQESSKVELVIPKLKGKAKLKFIHKMAVKNVLFDLRNKRKILIDSPHNFYPAFRNIQRSFHFWFNPRRFLNETEKLYQQTAKAHKYDISKARRSGNENAEKEAFEREIKKIFKEMKPKDLLALYKHVQEKKFRSLVYNLGNFRETFPLSPEAGLSDRVNDLVYNVMIKQLYVSVRTCYQQGEIKLKQVDSFEAYGAKVWGDSYKRDIGFAKLLKVVKSHSKPKSLHPMARKLAKEPTRAQFNIPL